MLRSVIVNKHIEDDASRWVVQFREGTLTGGHRKDKAYGFYHEATAAIEKFLNGYSIKSL